jgi:molecular chaperone HscC
MIIGIDLGTTNSIAAYWDSGEAKIIPNALGELLTPSVVSIDDNGNILVGKPALYRMVVSPENSVANFKRYIGTDKIFKIGPYQFRSEDLSALILKQLKEDAENYLNCKIEEAIISVPAYFSDSQRKATKIAGKLAGLNVERLINEPTAAGIAYGLQSELKETNYLVFDLGGGTFDVSILTLFSDIIEVRASGGDNLLGGIDFTQLLKSAFQKKIQTELKLGDTLPLALQQKIHEQAEIAKHQLSFKQEVVMKTQWKDHTIEYQFTYKEFEAQANNLLEKIQHVVQKVLHDANMLSSQIAQIVLVGGATRMPLIRNLVGKMFSKFPLSHLDPDLVVAKGAAIQAGLKSLDKALDEIVVTDVCPYSLGIAVASSSNNQSNRLHFDAILERNTVIPASRSRIYYPINPNQTHVEIQIYQGENYYIEKNIFLGKLKVDLNRNLKDPAIEVRFTYDINGLLEVEAKILETGETIALLIEGNPGVLAEAEIQDRLQILSKLKVNPREQTENVFLLNKAEHIYTYLSGDKRALWGNLIKEFEFVLDSQDPVRILQARKKLAEAIKELELNLTLV